MTEADIELLREVKRLLEEGTSNSLMAHQRQKWNIERERYIALIDERLAGGPE